MLDDFKNSELLEALLEMTNDENSDVRNLAIYDLREYDDKRVHELFLKIAEDESDPCRKIVLNYLDDPAMIDFYLKNLKCDWHDDRVDALFNIVDLCSDKRSKSDSEHEHPRERSSAEIKRMLRCPERKEIMEALSIAYRKFDSLPGTHSDYAYELVEIIKMFTPLEEEYKTILNTATKAHNPSIRFHAAMKLADIGQGNGLQILINILSETGPDWLRWKTVEHLVLIKDPRSVKLLLRLLETNDEKVKWSVAEVLGYLNDDLAVDPLIQLLEDRSKWVRAAAAKALGELGASSSIEPLIKLLDDDSEYPRYRAVEALGRMGNIGTISSLKTAFKDECHHVRMAAKRAISEIVENYFELKGD